MPGQKTKSALASKLGDKAKRSHEKHKNDEVRLDSGGSLPAGIELGIAELVDCKFGEYKDGKNKGQPFFIAAGVVVEPKDFNGIPIAGQRTQIGPEPLCDTPDAQGKRKTFDDHYDWVLNELRKLGLETKDLGVDDLEGAVASLKEAGPTFRFRTWQGTATAQFPNPRVQHVWNGTTDYVAEVTDAVVDETAEEGDAPADEAPWESDDLDETLKAADAGDAKAQAALLAKAEEAGVEGAPDMGSWEEVAAAIREATGEGQQVAEEKDWKPVKEEVYKYKPKGAKKPIEVEVIFVNETKKVVNLKNLDTSAKILGISWDDLIKD